MFPALIGTLLFGLSTPILAWKLPVGVQEQPTPFHLAENQDFNFDGILALSNCSASLVRFDDSNDTDFALALTNGHCVKVIAPGQASEHKVTFKRFSVLDPQGNSVGNLYANRLIYATMTKTDLALYKFKSTYAQIEDDYNVTALTISRKKALLGEPIEIISGYWKLGFRCQVDAFVYRLKEARWLFEDSLRYSEPGCEVYGGTSGSPVILEGTRTVVAVNNTGNEAGKVCKLNNPCEIDRFGNVSAKKGNGYAQQIHWLYTCRSSNPDKVLNLDQKGCLLPNPQSFSFIEN